MMCKFIFVVKISILRDWSFNDFLLKNNFDIDKTTWKLLFEAAAFLYSGAKYGGFFQSRQTILKI